MAEPDEWIPRSENGGEMIPDYDHPDYFTIKVYHGGYIDHSAGKYIGGSKSYYDNVDKDRMSLTEVDGMVRGINHAYGEQMIDYWYSIGENDQKIKLNNDHDTIAMCCRVPEIRVVILYLDHLELNPANEDYLDELFIYEDQIPAWSQAVASNAVIEELPDSPKKKLQVTNKKNGKRFKRLANRKGLHGVKISEPQEGVLTQASRAPTIDPTDKGKGKLEVELSESDSDSDAGFIVQDDNAAFLAYEDGLVEEYEDNDSGGDAKFTEDEGSEDDDYDPAKDDDDVAAYGVDDDFLFDWLTEIEGREKNEEGLSAAAAVRTVGIEESEVEDNEAMYGAVDSDEEVIGHELNSDDNGEGHKWPEFNPKTDMKNPQFCVGMLFATARILRAAVRERAIQKGWVPLLDRTEKHKLRIICKAADCKYELYASKAELDDTLQIKRYQPEHSCVRLIDNPTVRTPYLIARFSNMIKLNPDIKTESLKNSMAAELQANVSFQQAYRTKRAVLEQLERSMKEQYSRVQDYAHELRRVDPETTIDIKCDFSNSEKLPIFKRMYICLGALKLGFKSGCRPILGLDGCHLKSAYGGQLLCAVGLDANNTTYVVAYAMVEMESKDSWIWFLRLLEKDLNITGEGNGFTFISDKQKGLLPACEQVFPLADHRFCVRHLWTNFNKLFPGKAMKDQLWAIAKSTTMAYHWEEMMLIKQMAKDAYDWLTDPEQPTRNLKHWCRSHFNTILKCDVLVNNLCESFNAFILPARSKPVITGFEDIRVKLMKRIAARLEKMSKVIDPICPKPREILEKNKVKSTTDCIPIGTGSPVIEVYSIGGGKYVVDLQRRKCACRRWDLTGIPCKHAVSAINFMRQKPEDYVDACYLTKTYMAIYSNTVKPVNGMDLWMRTDEQAILPPQYNRQPGRPKNKRVKDASERNTEGGLKLGRVQKSLRCGNCGTLGHNIKTCHRHLPPKTPSAHGTGTKKRRLNSGEASSTKEKGTKPAPKTKNELREKAELRKAAARDKRNEKRAAAKAAGKDPPTRGRPPKAATSTVRNVSANAQPSHASSRSSVRIRANANKGGK